MVTAFITIHISGARMKGGRPVVTTGIDGGATVPRYSRNNKEIIEYNDNNSYICLYTRIIRYTSHAMAKSEQQHDPQL